MHTVQTSVFIGGCCDGYTMETHLPHQETIYMPPPPGPLPPINRTSKPSVKSMAQGDVYRLTTITISPGDTRLLFYRHDDLSEVEAFLMLFAHYGQKA